MHPTALASRLLANFSLYHANMRQSLTKTRLHVLRKGQMGLIPFKEAHVEVGPVIISFKGYLGRLGERLEGTFGVGHAKVRPRRGQSSRLEEEGVGARSFSDFGSPEGFRSQNSASEVAAARIRNRVEAWHRHSTMANSLLKKDSAFKAPLSFAVHPIEH